MGSGAEKAGNAAEIDRLALAVAKDPGSKAFIPLAEEYGKAGMWDEAAGVLEDGLTAFPHFITAMVALGRVYEQLNQPAKAIAILEEAVKLSPENFGAHRTLAKIYAAQGVKEAGLRSCYVILTANPQDAEVLSLHARLEALAVPTPPTPPQPQAVIESVQPASGIIAAVEQMQKPQPAAVVAGDVSGATTESAAISSSSQPKSTTVTQLEQWLTSIRARRRSQAVSAVKNS